MKTNRFSKPITFYGIASIFYLFASLSCVLHFFIDTFPRIDIVFILIGSLCSAVACLLDMKREHKRFQELLKEIEKQ